VTYIVLQGNQITSIESGAFNGLPLLTTLDLSYNQIAVIDKGLFEELSSLNDLEL
jgi:Leucine-rich repeat (LRR) protein